jgi:hypothetical protein
VGSGVGEIVGSTEGTAVGENDGLEDGALLGFSEVGILVGDGVGKVEWI